MPLFSIEHTAAAYRADFVFYGAAVLGLGTWLAVRGPAAARLEIIACAAAGILVWSAIEYAVHRFVLHGLPPFSVWHGEHHRRPAALICSPTVLSASLIGLLVWLPAVLLLGRSPGSALTLGVLIGYLVYAITHHAVHHWHPRSPWLQRRKRWHARHHHLRQPCCYGVTTGFWDRVFGTAGNKGHGGHGRARIPLARHRE